MAEIILLLLRLFVVVVVVGFFSLSFYLCVFGVLVLDESGWTGCTLAKDANNNIQMTSFANYFVGKCRLRQKPLDTSTIWPEPTVSMTFRDAFDTGIRCVACGHISHWPVILTERYNSVNSCALQIPGNDVICSHLLLRMSLRSHKRQLHRSDSIVRWMWRHTATMCTVSGNHQNGLTDLIF